MKSFVVVLLVVLLVVPGVLGQWDNASPSVYPRLTNYSYFKDVDYSNYLLYSNNQLFVNTESVVKFTKSNTTSPQTIDVLVDGSNVTNVQFSFENKTKCYATNFSGVLGLSNIPYLSNASSWDNDSQNVTSDKNVWVRTGWFNASRLNDTNLSQAIFPISTQTNTGANALQNASMSVRGILSGQYLGVSTVFPATTYPKDNITGLWQENGIHVLIGTVVALNVSTWFYSVQVAAQNITNRTILDNSSINGGNVTGGTINGARLSWMNVTDTCSESGLDANNIAPTTATPAMWGNTSAVCVTFNPSLNINVRNISVRTLAVGAQFDLGIYRASGAVLINSSPLMGQALRSVNGMVSLNNSVGVNLTAGDDYVFCLGNKNATGGTAIYTLTGSIGTLNVPRFFNVSMTTTANSSLPTSLGTKTLTAGGFPCAIIGSY